jgi:Arc/MetJ-type ribon-helix-helix transcriptional regulator
MAKIGVRKGNVVKLSISISDDSASWIENEVENLKYRTVSNAIESLIQEKKANKAT